MTADPALRASGQLWPRGHDQPDAGRVVVVRGRPDDRELAALVAVLAARRTAVAPAPSPYEVWRAGRLAALRNARIFPSAYLTRT